MKISKLVYELELFKQAHGDLDVFLQDQEWGTPLEITELHKQRKEKIDHPLQEDPNGEVIGVTLIE
jgi:hypothetical protein